jgi:glycosyltransferase involved in cell wall biosynthesis
MNILVINDYTRVIGGAERFLDNLIKESPPDIHFRSINVSSFVHEGSRMGFVRPFSRVFHKYLLQHDVIHQIKAQIREFQPDLIHVNNNHLCTNSVTHAVRSFGKPVVHFVHDYYTLRKLESPWFIKDKRKSIYLTHERQIYNRLKATGQKAHLVKVPFDPGKWTVWEKTVADLPHYDLLYVGRLEKTKGVYLLLEALRMIRENMPGITLTMIGEGSERERLDHYITKHQLERNVQILATQDDAQLAVSYRKARLVVMPAPRESLGYVGLEAQASGVPVVAFANEGTERWCQDNLNGFLVREISPRNLADRILEIIDDAVLLARISNSARESIFQGKYNSTDQHITDIYKAALS